MPIKTQRNLPAGEVLKKENIFVMDETRALHQDIRPLKIGVVNLMPLKEATEIDLLRSLSNTPLQIDVTFISLESHEATHTALSHLNRFYEPFSKVGNRNFDGLIITGAPVEQLDFEDVDYWDELCRIMDWSKTHVTSTLHICWGAQAGLYHHYGIRKHLLDSKRFGIYQHRVLNRKVPLVRGFDDVFSAPHSRHTEVSRDDIAANPELEILSESDEAGVYLVIAHEGHQIFVMGHPEYDRCTLQREYLRDKGRGLEIAPPLNYYPNDDDTKEPLLTWRSHANILYSNWLNYYVYQESPYEFAGRDMQ